jgi:hypothetical protein
VARIQGWVRVFGTHWPIGCHHALQRPEYKHSEIYATPHYQFLLNHVIRLCLSTPTHFHVSNGYAMVIVNRSRNQSPELSICTNTTEHGNHLQRPFNHSATMYYFPADVVFDYHTGEFQQKFGRERQKRVGISGLIIMQRTLK